MSEHLVNERFGPFRLVRELSPCAFAERWIAMHERDGSNHTMYCLPASRNGAERRRVIEAVETICTLDHPHLLPVEQFSFDDGGRPWIVCPYTGNQDALVTLADLIDSRGGRMQPIEVERSLEHLLSALAEAHAKNIHHGPVALDEVHVDRRGSLIIELFGLKRRLEGFDKGNDELARDGIRRIVELGYQLLTGLPAEEPRVLAGSIVKKLDKGWDQWFEAGLSPTAGFNSARDAIDALPSGPRTPADVAEMPEITTVMRRLRRSFTTGRSR